jgi:hypothetical protein
MQPAQLPAKRVVSTATGEESYSQPSGEDDGFAASAMRSQFVEFEGFHNDGGHVDIAELPHRGCVI